MADFDDRRYQSAVVQLEDAAKHQSAVMPKRQREALEERAARSEGDAVGQYLLLRAENFNQAPETAEEMQRYADAGVEAPEALSSYLRLGAVPPDVREALEAYAAAATSDEPLPDSIFDRTSGEDLAVKVLDFTDDDMRRCAESVADPEVAPAGRPNFAHDYHAPSVRQAASAKLHTTGGWREHTEGNRVSTTRGDKVEVIGGNFKLLVLCRDELGNLESGHEASGGHVSGATGTRGKQTHQATAGRDDATGSGDSAKSVVGVAWESRSGGVWRSVENASKGDSEVLQHGDLDDHMCGHYQKSSTGSDAPDTWHEPEDCTDTPDECKGNPKILDRTWAERMESYTGSAAWRVPVVESSTHVTDMTSETHAKTLSDETRAESMSSSTSAGTMGDVTTVGLMQTTTTVDGCMTDTTIGNTVATTNGNTLDITIAPQASLTAGMMEDHTWGMSVSGFVGLRGEVTLGRRSSTSVGAEVDIKIGYSNQRTVGYAVQTSLSGKTDISALAKTDTGLFKDFKALLISLG